jgi:hypothetical protein
LTTYSFWLKPPALGCNKNQINDEEKSVKLKFSRAALAALFAAAGIMSAHAQIFEANEGVEPSENMMPQRER